MAQAEYIKHFWEKEDKFLRESTQITNLNLRTVRKNAQKGDWSENGWQHAERRSPVLQDYTPIIDRWLEDDLKEVFSLRQHRTIHSLRFKRPSACRFSAIFHKNAHAYIQYSLRFLTYLTKNRAAHLDISNHAVLPLIKY